MYKTINVFYFIYINLFYTFFISLINFTPYNIYCIVYLTNSISFGCESLGNFFNALCINSILFFIVFFVFNKLLYLCSNSFRLSIMCALISALVANPLSGWSILTTCLMLLLVSFFLIFFFSISFFYNIFLFDIFLFDIFICNI